MEPREERNGSSSAKARSRFWTRYNSRSNTCGSSETSLEPRQSSRRSESSIWFSKRNCTFAPADVFLRYAKGYWKDNSSRCRSLLCSRRKRPRRRTTPNQRNKLARSSPEALDEAQVELGMSALDQKQTLKRFCAMSALPPKERTFVSASGSLRGHDY